MNCCLCRFYSTFDNLLIFNRIIINRFPWESTLKKVIIIIIDFNLKFVGKKQSSKSSFRTNSFSILLLVESNELNFFFFGFWKSILKRNLFISFFTSSSSSSSNNHQHRKISFEISINSHHNHHHHMSFDNIAQNIHKAEKNKKKHDSVKKAYPNKW